MKIIKCTYGNHYMYLWKSLKCKFLTCISWSTSTCVVSQVSIACSTMLTRVVLTVVNLMIAVPPLVSILTGTRVSIHSVFTRTMLARLRCTLVNVTIAVIIIVTCRANTAEAVHKILTFSSIVARFRCAFVNVSLTV